MVKGYQECGAVDVTLPIRWRSVMNIRLAKHRSIASCYLVGGRHRLPARNYERGNGEHHCEEIHPGADEELSQRSLVCSRSRQPQIWTSRMTSQKRSVTACEISTPGKSRTPEFAQAAKLLSTISLPSCLGRRREWVLCRLQAGRPPRSAISASYSRSVLGP
jgi:hypothetical protein